MLSYRHSYHAGNHADVLKHMILTLCLNALKEKEKDILYLDTHAGAGRYLLCSEHAEKTAEYRGGIARIWQANDFPDFIAPYLNLIKHLNPEHQLMHYPGSPWIAKTLLRAQDHLIMTDLHPTDIALLKQSFKHDPRATVLFENGLMQFKSKLPPKTRRGLILIDPSYEIKSDYQKVPEAILQGHKRFATGVYLLWYPVVQRRWVDHMLEILEESGIKNIQQFEFAVAPDNNDKGMTASGMIAINPPWKLKSQMEVLFPILQRHLDPEKKGYYFIKQLVNESH